MSRTETKSKRRAKIVDKELTLNINGAERKLFFQMGFYSHDGYKNLDFHIHSYEEVHVFLGCTAEIICDKERYTVTPGEVVLIPRNSFHAYKMSTDAGSRHLTFQIDMPTESVKIKRLPEGLLSSMLSEASKMSLDEVGGDHSRVALYLAVVCGHFCEPAKIHTRTVRDYAFIIREYIGYNYAKNTTLDTLAAELCVSKKQAERLTQRYMQKTFLEALTEARMLAAEQYLAMENPKPLSQIAPLVGYQSYSGFYKAYKRYKAEKEAKKAQNVNYTLHYFVKKASPRGGRL